MNLTFECTCLKKYCSQIKFMSLSHHIISFFIASKDNITNQSPQGLMAREQLFFPHVSIYFITSYHLLHALFQFNYI